MPITEWRALLAAFGEAGGIQAPISTLRNAGRSRLRNELPGRQPGRELVEVPSDLQAALLAHGPPDPAAQPDPRHAFLGWLREQVAESGPALTLVTTTDESREIVGALARIQDSLIATLSEEEAARV